MCRVRYEPMCRPFHGRERTPQAFHSLTLPLSLPRFVIWQKYRIVRDKERCAAIEYVSAVEHWEVASKFEFVEKSTVCSPRANQQKFVDKTLCQKALVHGERSSTKSS